MFEKIFAQISLPIARITVPPLNRGVLRILLSSLPPGLKKKIFTLSIPGVHTPARFYLSHSFCCMLHIKKNVYPLHTVQQIRQND